MPVKIINRTSSKSVLMIALMIGLVNGLIFVALVPPWQHYDEPTHFEYAWLIAKRRAIPAPGDYSRSMRQEVAESMLRNDFFRGMNYTLDLNPKSGQVWIGPNSQLNNPPLYYLIASLPISLLRDYKVEFQLITGRLIAFLFYLITVTAAWGVIIEITPADHLLRLLVPVTIAFLPGLADSMTAMNNDSAAIALTSLCLWGSVRLVRRGFSLFNFLWVASTAVLSLFTKETAIWTIPLAAFAFLMAVFPRSRRWIAWSVVGAAIIGLGALSLTYGDSAGWYRSTSQRVLTRAENPRAVDGRYVFQLDASAGDTPTWIPSLFQPVLVRPPEPGAQITYTLGAWMWASQPTRARLPILGDGYKIHTEYAEVGIEPTFHSMTVTIPTDQGVRLWVSLDPTPDDPKSMIYYDGLILTEDALPIGEQIQIQPIEASDISERMQFNNLLRNASAEQAGLRIRPILDDFGSNFLPDHIRPSVLLTYFMDWRGAGWQYLLTTDRLLKTFWGQFGWGHVNLIGDEPYRFFYALTLLGVVGAVIWFIRRFAWCQKLSWDLIALFAILMVGTWLGTVSRGAIYMGITRLYLPVARYAYPAIIPTVIMLSVGWLELAKLPSGFDGWKKVHPKFTVSVWVLILVLIDIYAIASIYTYYSR